MAVGHFILEFRQLEQGPVVVQVQGLDQQVSRAGKAAANPRRKVPRGGEFAIRFGGKEGVKRVTTVALSMSQVPKAPRQVHGAGVHHAGLRTEATVEANAVALGSIPHPGVPRRERVTCVVSIRLVSVSLGANANSNMMELPQPLLVQENHLQRKRLLHARIPLILLSPQVEDLCRPQLPCVAWHHPSL